jgi:hypothetical protein
MFKQQYVPHVVKSERYERIFKLEQWWRQLRWKIRRRWSRGSYGDFCAVLFGSY